MDQIIPSFIMGFREGLEAFLLIAIILKYISKVNQPDLKSKVLQGSIVGLIISLMLGMLLNAISTSLGGAESLTKVWESVASLIALVLVTMFIFWMIRHGRDIAKHVEGQVEKNLSAYGLFFISLVIVAREGTEIAIFSFAGKYPFSPVATGVLASFALTVLIFYSLVKINIGLLFKITLAYLILQAGYLLGYTFHEGFSALKEYEMISGENIIFAKAFDVSKTIFSHKDGIVGIPLHVVFGWYSKPEWIQFIIQYMYTILVFVFWFFDTRELSLTEQIATTDMDKPRR
ncbi:MAG: FTR1 family protein [Deltaproteobacteria bacterium]|nr:FTR1 family protein [Deltaproteobacteria bacterium]MBW1849445.1 FTR1 family protein [Deltaproteobacteria bacterium]